MSTIVTGQGNTLMIFDLKNGETSPRIQLAESAPAAQDILNNYSALAPDMEVHMVVEISKVYAVHTSTHFQLVDTTSIE